VRTTGEWPKRLLGFHGEQIGTRRTDPVDVTLSTCVCGGLVVTPGVTEVGATTTTGKPKWARVRDMVSSSLPPEPLWVVVTRIMRPCVVQISV
jgi:hypothetical protein